MSLWVERSLEPRRQIRTFGSTLWVGSSTHVSPEALSIWLNGEASSDRDLCFAFFVLTYGSDRALGSGSQALGSSYSSCVAHIVPLEKLASFSIMNSCELDQWST